MLNKACQRRSVQLRRCVRERALRQRLRTRAVGPNTQRGDEMNEQQAHRAPAPPPRPRMRGPQRARALWQAPAARSQAGTHRQPQETLQRLAAGAPPLAALLRGGGKPRRRACAFSPPPSAGVAAASITKVYNWVDNWITPKTDGESPVTVKPGHWPLVWDRTGNQMMVCLTTGAIQQIWGAGSAVRVPSQNGPLAAVTLRWRLPEGGGGYAYEGVPTGGGGRRRP